MTDVPINPVTRRVQFTGNTGTGPYAFTFNILQASDIAVFKNTATLTLTNDYTVAINANGTGAVTLVAALIASDLLTITGGRELSRTTDFVTGGPLLAGTLNEQLDSNVIMSQQLDEKFDRSLKIAQSDFTANLTLPIKSVRANQLLGFDASGNAVAGTGSTLNLTVANLTASSLTIPIGGSTVIEGFSFDSGKISTTITNDPLELYSNGTGTVIASPSLTVDNLKLDGNTFSSINSNGDINIFPNGSGTVNMDADLMVYGNDVNGVASYVQISASATGGDDIRLQGSNPVVASYDTSNVSAQTPSMLGAFSLYGKDTSGNYIAYATLRGYAEDPFAGTNGKEGSLRIQINDDSSIREHKFTATGLDVYNNITLSGTVDGRDIASDGSKLDGITANATTYSFSDTNGTVTVTPAQGNAATLIIGTAAGSGGLAMRGNAGGADSVALGTSSNAIGVNAITIGKSATTSTGSNSPTNGIAIGEQAHSYGSGTTALGRQASSIGDNSIALGSYASVPATYHSSVALGTSATVNAANQIMLGTSNKTVKIPGVLTVDGNITAGGTVDGRDIDTDGTKLDGIETSADVTDATNVAAAGALMKSGGAMTGAITTNSTFDTRDVATDGTKLDTIETNADVTDATNVNAAGAVMVVDTSTSGMGFVIDEDNMVSNSATKIPTQQSVKAYVDLNVSSSVQYRGSYNAATNTPNLDSSPSGITIGDMYTTTVAGTFYSTGLEIGDVLIAEVDDPSSVNDWTIVQQNLDAASIKTLYESNADTNAFDDAEQTRLAGIEAGAEVNIGQYFMISANSQGVANGEIITTHPNASGITSEVIDFTGAGGLTVARAGNNLTFTSANTTYGFADSNGTVTITPSTGSAATLVIGTAAGSGGLAFRGNAGGADSVALGTSSNAIGVNAIAIGKSATTSYGSNSPTNGIAIGEQAHSYGANTVALGRQASAEGASGTALGPYANVPSSYYNSVALGISATVTASNQIMLGTSGTAVNVPGTLSATGNSTFAGTVTIGGETRTTNINTASSTGTLVMYGGATNKGGTIELSGGNNTGATGSGIVFKTGASTSSPSERVRIDKDGNITQSSGDYLYSGGGNFDIKHTIASQNIVFSTTPSGGSATEILRITHDGKLSKLSGDLTLDVAGDIILDADGGQVYLKDNSGLFGELSYGDTANNGWDFFDIKAWGNSSGNTDWATVRLFSGDNEAFRASSNGTTVSGDASFNWPYSVSHGTGNYGVTIGSASKSIIYLRSGVSGGDADGTQYGEFSASSSTMELTAWNSAALKLKIATTDAITIDTSANVAIPNGNLNVTGTVTATTNLIVDGTTGGSSNIRFYDGGAESWILYQNNSTNNLAFRRNSSDRVTLDASGNATFAGNVGINKAINSSVGLSVGADSTATNSYGLEVTNASANTRFLVDGVGSSFFYKTDNNVGMKFDSSSGNVGIGTTTVNARLDIDGAAGSPATSGTTQNGIVRIRNATNNNALDIGQVAGSPYGTWIQASDVTDLSYEYPLILNPNGGNVGIGITGPTAPLEISTTATRVLAINSSHSNGGYLTIKESGTDKFYIGKSQAVLGTTGGYTMYAGSGYGLTFNVNGQGSPAVVIDSSDNVGIGTTSPSSYLATKLVIGCADEDGMTLAATSGSTKQNIYFADGTSGSARNRGNISYDHADDSLRMGTASGNSRFVMDTSGNVMVGATSLSANEKFRVDGAQLTGSGAAGLYTVSLAQTFAASAAKYLRIQLNNNLFGALTITATGDYSSVNAIGVFQKVYSVGINSANTSIYSADNNTTLDMGGTSGVFSMGTPSKPNATTYYVPMANLNASYPIAMSLVVEMRGFVEGITSVDIIAQ